MPGREYLARLRAHPFAKETYVCTGSSFIYDVVLSAELPWVYGGEYTRFARLVEQVVRAWIEVGLELHFVFDGA